MPKTFIMKLGMSIIQLKSYTYIPIDLQVNRNKYIPAHVHDIVDVPHYWEIDMRLNYKTTFHFNTTQKWLN